MTLSRAATCTALRLCLCYLLALQLCGCDLSGSKRPSSLPECAQLSRDVTQHEGAWVLGGTLLGELAGPWAGGRNILNPAREEAQISVQTEVCMQTGAG